MKHIKLFEQFVIESKVNEKREDVGKYNTVKKVISKLGRRPSEQDLATFINNNYYDVTEVERGDNDERADDKIADLVGFYKFDTDDWEIAWADAQNESKVNEAKLRLKVEVPMRDPEIKKFIHNYLLLNKKYSMHRMPEYSMKFGENKSKKETHWKYDTANNILYVHDAKVVDRLVKGGAPSDLFES
jgi:hypothetical protein|tara:strand:+ start:682 stop:1242 length:561 start_codon:yes stop_codon:yes gene_type:complete